MIIPLLDIDFTSVDFRCALGGHGAEEKWVNQFKTPARLAVCRSTRKQPAVVIQPFVFIVANARMIVSAVVRQKQRPKKAQKKQNKS